MSTNEQDSTPVLKNGKHRYFTNVVEVSGKGMIDRTKKRTYQPGELWLVREKSDNSPEPEGFRETNEKEFVERQDDLFARMSVVIQKPSIKSEKHVDDGRSETSTMTSRPEDRRR